MRKAAVITIIAATLLLSACDGSGPDQDTPSSSTPAALELPAEFLGTWRLTGSSGRLSGDGEQVGDGVLLILAEGSTGEIRAPGRPARKGEFTVRRGPTIFAEGDGWHIESEALGLTGVIEVSTDRRHLTISENHYDGFNWHYVREE